MDDLIREAEIADLRARLEKEKAELAEQMEKEKEQLREKMEKENQVCINYIIETNLYPILLQDLRDKLAGESNLLKVRT